MGYLLNALGNMPVDDDVHFYIYVINGNWREPLYETIEQNFAKIARSIGHHAVIAAGLEPQEWYGEVAKAYLGEHHDKYFRLLPALLITDSHPTRINEKTLRLLIPLRDAEKRFGGWTQFFSLLSDFVNFRSNDFLRKFESSKSLLGVPKPDLSLSAGVIGVSFNLEKIADWWQVNSLLRQATRQ